MAHTSAHLIEHVIPDVPVRQWVLSLPFALRYRVAFDTALLGQILRIFIAAIFASLRRQGRESGVPNGKCGAVTFIQRWGSALNLTPHFHILVFNGIYAAKDGETPRFYALRAPEKKDVVTVTERVAVRVAALLDSRNDESPEGDEPGLSALYGASVLGRIADGPNAGRRVATAGGSAGEENAEERFEAGRRRCANVSGFSVHAGVGIRQGRRKELERLIRYAARPPIANERLEQLPDGRLSYRLKTPWKNGATQVIFELLEFLGKLAALVPAPRANLVHYHGVVAPASKWRAAIVPEPQLRDSMAPECGCEAAGEPEKGRRRNYGWAFLMARVFEIDVLKCSHCNGRLKVIAAIHPPAVTRKILNCLGLPGRAPPLHPAIPEVSSEDF